MERSAQEFLQNVSKVPPSAAVFKILDPIIPAAKSEVKRKPLEKHVANLISNIKHWMLDEEMNWKVQ